MGAPVSKSMYLNGAPVGFPQASKAALQTAFIYQGRASRSAYWWFALALAYTAILLAAVLLRANHGAGAIIISILGFGMIYPFMASLALTVRRLHDTDRSGWWYLIALVPYVGVIILVVILARAGTPGPNRYQPGAVPLVTVKPGRTLWH